MSNETANKFTGRHMLAWLGGLFGAMLLANGIFVYYALTTFTGLETQHAYREGLAYNSELARARAQAELGWQVELTQGPLADGGVDFTLRYTDRNGAPVTALTIDAVLRHPATKARDRKIILRETAPGTYHGRVAGISAGQWEIRLAATAATGATDTPHQQIERLWIK